MDPLTALFQKLLPDSTLFTNLMNSAMGPNRLVDMIGQALNSMEVSGSAVADSKSFLSGLTAVADIAPAVGKAAVITPGFGPASPSVTLAKGIQIGGLSVPQTWPMSPLSANQTATLASTTRAAAGESLVTAKGGMPRGALGGLAAMAGMPGASARGEGPTGFRFVPRYGYRHRVVNRPPNAG